MLRRKATLVNIGLSTVGLIVRIVAGFVDMNTAGYGNITQDCTYIDEWTAIGVIVSIPYFLGASFTVILLFPASLFLAGRPRLPSDLLTEYTMEDN